MQVAREVSNNPGNKHRTGSQGKAPKGEKGFVFSIYTGKLGFLRACNKEHSTPYFQDKNRKSIKK